MYTRIVFVSLHVLLLPWKRRRPHISGRYKQVESLFNTSWTICSLVRRHGSRQHEGNSTLDWVSSSSRRVVLGGVRQVTLYQGVIPAGMPGAQHFMSTELAALRYSSSLLTDVARDIWSLLGHYHEPFKGFGRVVLWVPYCSRFSESRKCWL